MQSILCPHCGKTLELSEALRHEIEEKIQLETAAKHKIEIDLAKKTAFIEAEKKIKLLSELELKNAEAEKVELREKTEKQEKEMLTLFKQVRELKQSAKEQELELEKRLTLELEKRQVDLEKTLTEKARLKELEYEKKISDMQKSLEEAQRKATQGSQQLQGEVLELDFEARLREAFPFDELLPVPKGITGADIWHRVRNKHGQIAGSILWEFKRTKAWSAPWLAKLREDTRAVNADMSLLVSNVLPEGCEHYDMISGVWVTSYDHALRVANMLRICLLQIAIAKSGASHKDEKLQEIYQYITSQAFRHKFEAHFESVKTLQEDLEIERRSMERMWKKREVQIQRLDRSATQMFGEIQGIVGNLLPSIAALSNEPSSVIEE